MAWLLDKLCVTAFITGKEEKKNTVKQRGLKLRSQVFHCYKLFRTSNTRKGVTEEKDRLTRGGKGGQAPSAPSRTDSVLPSDALGKHRAVFRHQQMLLHPGPRLHYYLRLSTLEMSSYGPV